MEDKLRMLQSEIVSLNRKLIILANKIDSIEKLVNPESMKIAQAEIMELKGLQNNIMNRLSTISKEIVVLDEKIIIVQQKSVKLPNTQLLSHSPWKRMWAIWGYCFLASIILASIISVPFVLLV